MVSFHINQNKMLCSQNSFFLFFLLLDLYYVTTREYPWVHSSGCEHRIITCSHSVQNLQFEKASQGEEDVRQEEGTRNSLFRQLMDMYFLDNINLPLKLHLICYMLHTSISPILPFPMLLT